MVADNLSLGGAAVLCGMGRLRFDDAGANGAAGTYTVNVVIPANAIVIDVIVHSVALWNAGTSATLTVGDVAVTNGIFAAVDAKATDLLATESLSTANAGGKAGGDIAASQFNRRTLSTSRTYTLKVVTVGSSTTGETWLIIPYAIESAATINRGSFV